ncbi:MAG: polyphosphate:AMP phosphotransferase [Pseudomonadota bacterium]
MFEVAELGLAITGEEFDSRAPQLHLRLLEAQRALSSTRHTVLILLSGVEGAGKGELVSRLHEWFDTKGIQTAAFWDETDEENLRPRYWRFWRAMPARGKIGIMFGSWYTEPFIERVYDKIDDEEFERRLEEINEFETLLRDDGVIIIKLWFHMPKDKVEKQLERDEKKHIKKLRISPYTKRFARYFDKFIHAAQLAIRKTDTDIPWHIVEATDGHYRDITAGQIILDVMNEHLDPKTKPATKKAHFAAESVERAPPLASVDLTQKLDDVSYQRKLQKWQGELHALAWRARELGKSVVVVFEGWDAAGKGSTIQRMIKAVDARLFRVITTGAPTDEEAAHHYLWRFWRHVPMPGNFTIYDRSWYGRVLVERVEKLASQEEWYRAYDEINLFEQQLSDHNILVLKFWLHISPEEQLRRFDARENDPLKNHKLTKEDWRNRDKRKEYELAVNEMVAHTSTICAPWNLIAAEDKQFARIEVLRILSKALKQELK